MKIDFRTTETIALINGEKQRYDAADKNKDCDVYANWDYLGKGVIYSVGGVVDSSMGPKQSFYFWRAKR